MVLLEKHDELCVFLGVCLPSYAGMTMQLVSECLVSVAVGYDYFS